MRKLILATILSGSMGASVALAIPSSGVISAVQTGGAATYGVGGQFTATVAGYPSFQTWCLEINNSFAGGYDYNYTLGQATHDNPPGSSPLKLGTAWLVAQWNDGAFGSSLVVGEFQAALWYFQNQNFGTGLGFGTWGNGAPSLDIYTALAISALGGSLNAFSASNGAYGIQVIETSQIVGNSYPPDTGGQDWVYVPDGGTTIMLLGLGLTGLALCSRRFGVAR